MPRSKNSRAETCVAAKTTGGAAPASSASFQRSRHNGLDRIVTENQPVPAGTKPATRPPRRSGCVWIILALCGLVLSAVVCVAFLVFFALDGKNLKISQETTFITSPLKNNGEQVDYFVAWEQETYPDAIATDENGYRLIVQHLGAPPDSSPDHFSEVCRRLGLDAGAIEPDTRFEEPFSFLQASVASADVRLSENEIADVEPADEESSQDGMADVDHGGDHTYDESYRQELVDVLESRYQRPWTLDDLPMMEAWLADNNSAIDLISEAVRKPLFHIPQARRFENDPLIAMLLPDVQNLRSFARAFNVRANYRIGTGDIDGAIDDIVACKRLGRHVGHEGILIELLVGIAIEGIADSIGVAGSLEHPPTKGPLERLVGELNDLPPVGEFDKAMLFERYSTLDIVQSMSHGTNVLSDVEIPKWALRMSFDWNVIARRLNGHHDAMLASGVIPTPDPRPMAVFSTKVRSEFFADVLGALLLPAVDAAREATRRRLCTQRMHHINLAMLLYESDHGTLPPAYTVDTDGNPLHSWRVLVLPYLGQRTLYDKIRLDEPWDSQHNQKFHGEIVACYQCPSMTLSPGQTTYSVVVGPEMPFEGGDGKKLAAFGPKSVSMILLVERTRPVGWMDPTNEIPQAVADAGIDVIRGAGGGVASAHPGGANAGLRNGCCQFLPETIEPALFEGLLRGTVEEVP